MSADSELATVASAQELWEATLSNTQKRALSLLGQGVSQVMVASSLGVTESLVSQFMAQKEFSEAVVQRRLATLQKVAAIDDKYMRAEDRLLDKLHKSIPLITKPADILNGLRVVNAAKRRGSGEQSSSLHQGAQIVQITLPTVMAARFIVDTRNQVVEVQDGEDIRSLVTASSASLDRYAAESEPKPAGLLGRTESDFRAEEVTGAGWEGLPVSSNQPKSAGQEAAERLIKQTVSARLTESFSRKAEITEDDL